MHQHCEDFPPTNRPVAEEPGTWPPTRAVIYGRPEDTAEIVEPDPEEDGQIIPAE